MESGVLIQIVSVVILIMSVVCHEVAHGVVALWQGDDTAYRLGRLTLNPIPHLDMVGSILLPIILLISGSPVVFGWAKPVPFIISRLRNHRWGPALVALAGPATNIILALIATGGARLAMHLGSPVAATVCAIIVITNIALALFNLVPLPPLDGHHVVIAIFGQRAQVLYRHRWISVVGTLVAVFIVWQFLSPVVVKIVTWLLGA